MSPVLPLDIIALVIDIVGENKDTNLLKELALVSHSVLQICNKHLFATVELHDAVPNYHVASSKKGFVKLLKSRPDVVRYIRKLTYKVTPTYPSFDNDDQLLSPILPNFLRTISRLNCLTINALKLDWNTLDSSLQSALLHLMHLPTINHIDLSCIGNFPISSLTSCVNLHRLDISNLDICEVDGSSSPEIVVQSEMIPKILEFYTSESPLLTTKLLLAKRQDGRPAFNFTDLGLLSVYTTSFEDERNIRYILQNAKLLEELHLTIRHDLSLLWLHDILSISSSTLKVLDLSISLYDLREAGLCEGLETMVGYNMLEVLSIEFKVNGCDTEEKVGSIIQDVEKVLVGPGWSALRQVSFKVSIFLIRILRPSESLFEDEKWRLYEKLQSLPDRYLSHLPKLESVVFKYSVDY